MSSHCKRLLKPLTNSRPSVASLSPSWCASFVQGLGNSSPPDEEEFFVEQHPAPLDPSTIDVTWKMLLSDLDENTKFVQTHNDIVLQEFYRANPHIAPTT
jgi:hypothetical protein